MTIDELLEHLFPEEEARRREGKCPLCAQPIDPEAFRDADSRREFSISGMCQDCQDEFFQV